MDKLAIAHADEPPEVTEVCPHCESEVTLHWDIKNRGYKAYCPVCGERLMLCSACHSNEYRCDYDRKTDGCQWAPAMKWQLIRETHAKALLMYIRKNAENGEIELTKLQKRCRGNSYFKTSEAREAALEELERCGYIRIKTLKYPAGGRPVTIIGLTKEGKENGSLYDEKIGAWDVKKEPYICLEIATKEEYELYKKMVAYWWDHHDAEGNEK